MYEIYIQMYKLLIDKNKVVKLSIFPDKQLPQWNKIMYKMNYVP